MDNITLGQIVGAIGTLSVIGGVLWRIHNIINKAQEDRIVLNNTIKDLSIKVDNMGTNLNDKIEQFEFNHMKSALVNYLCIAETIGLTEEQKKNAHELYDLYVSKGGNSYIKHRFEKLEEENKI